MLSVAAKQGSFLFLKKEIRRGRGGGEEKSNWIAILQGMRRARTFFLVIRQG